MRQRVDYVEPDICLTSDGHAICMHDFELSLTTDVAERPEFANKWTTITLPSGSLSGWFTNNFTLAEIKSLRVKQRMRTRELYYDGFFQVPTLNETIRMVKSLNRKLGLQVGVYIEPKHPAYFESMGLRYDDHLIEVLTTNGLRVKRSEGQLSKLFIECFESTQLQRLRSRMDLPFVQLIKEPWEIQDDTKEKYVEMMSADGLTKIAQYANAIGPLKNYFLPQNKTFISICNPDTLIGPTAVDFAHSLKLTIHPWTLRNSWEDAAIKEYFGNSEEAQLRYLYDIGIDGVFTESAAAAFYVRKEYELSFVAAPQAPSQPNQDASIALMIVVPVLLTILFFLVGTAFGRYGIPHKTPSMDERLGLLETSVQ